MSHTMNVGKFTIYHNGGFDGDITFWTADSKEGFDIPFSVLAAVVAEAVRRQKISELEDMDDNTLLGLDDSR